jgi:uncharacterized protein (TIGR02687 family)
MNLDDIQKVLNQMLNKEKFDDNKRNIVFWYDNDKEFEDDIDDISIPNAKTIKLNHENSFYIKYILEKEDVNSNYLIYSPMSKPNNKENWLLDILLYSSEFSTDKTSLTMRDLDINDESLRPVFKKYAKFFNNKDRYKRFKLYEYDILNEETIDVLVMSVLCKVQSLKPDFEDVLKTILAYGLNGNKLYEQINKFGDIEVFWKYIDFKYGYTKERDLINLFRVFLITNLSYYFAGKIPDSWIRYISQRKADVVVLLDNFMNNSQYNQEYKKLIKEFEGELKLSELTSKRNIEDYIKCDSFKIFDEAIIERLVINLVNEVYEFEKYRKYINIRRTTYWFSEYEKYYNVIYNAMEILRIVYELNGKIQFNKAYDIVNNYVNRYYLIDLHYRKFYTMYDKCSNKEMVEKLLDLIENKYTNWYLNELSNVWSKSIENRDTWNINLLEQQANFYNKYVSDHVRKDERVYVIISDGLRYEAAAEFSELLNSERKGSTKISYMQGVIPSYTKLGMTALLPHLKIEMNEAGDYLVNGLSSSGLENREKILGEYSKSSVAISYNSLRGKNREEYKKIFAGKKLFYIYHDTIDGVGENSTTEDMVFEAVETAFTEINEIIKNLINNLSAVNIVVTSDHGFIYRTSELMEYDKLDRELNNKPIEKKKRYILTDKDENLDKTLKFNMDYILKNKNIKTIHPRGFNYFKTSGKGFKYMHGGLSLQETIVPVIKFKNIRNKSDKFEVKKVSVKLTSIFRKITNRITFLEFFQVEKVHDKVIPLRLKLYFTDLDGNKISNENIIIADSRSLKPEDRTYKEKFTLKDIKYDKLAKYNLILEDEDEKVEKIYLKIPFTIDLIINNDFGF